MSVEFDKQLKLFRVALKGRIVMKDAFGMVQELLNHPSFRPGIPAIWDAHGADLSDLKFDDIQQFRLFQAQRADQRGKARIALVAGDELSFGVGRMIEQIADLPNLKISVFRNMKEAEVWAQGISPDE